MGCVLWILIDADRNLSDREIEDDLIRRHLLIGGLQRVQIKGRAQGWMTGKWEFFLNGKYADLFSFSSFRRRVAWNDEGRFGKIHFLRQRLHLVIADLPRIRKDRQRVALKRRLRENVQLNEVVRPFHH